jgi:hypothetical protein
MSTISKSKEKFFLMRVTNQENRRNKINLFIEAKQENVIKNKHRKLNRIKTKQIWKAWKLNTFLKK